VSNEIPYVIRKNGMYYAHNSCGYVSRVLLAELYTEEYAKRHAEQCGECEAIPVTACLTGPDEVQDYIDRLEVMRDVMKETWE
jgi:hypothetical protein